MRPAKGKYPGRMRVGTRARIALLGGLGVVLLLVGLVATGMTEDQGEEEPMIATHLAVHRINQAGEAAFVLALGVVATGDQDATLTFRNGQTYDFVVVQDEQEVWRWSSGRMFHQAFVERTFPSGALELFVEVWDGRDLQGKPVTGEVEIHAQLTADPGWTATPVHVRVD